MSGLSGNPIRSLAKRFVIDAVRIIREEQLDLVVLATGGVTKHEHFKEFLDFFSDFRMFTYTPLISCRGRKPEAD